MTSLSDRTRSLDKEHYSEVERIYGDAFPLEVRFHLAHWIEDQFKPGLNIPESSPQMLLDLSHNLFAKLDEYVNALPEDHASFLIKKKLRDDLTALRMRYMNYPAALAVTVKQCLDQEAAVVARAEGKSFPPHSDAALIHQIRQTIAFLKNQIRTEISTEVNRIKQEHESINMDVYSLRDMSSNYARMVSETGENNETKKALEQKNKMQMDLTNKLARIIQRFKHLEDKIKGVFESVKGVQKEVLDTKLDAWKREQQLAGNGLQITQSLENIQGKDKGRIILSEAH